MDQLNKLLQTVEDHEERGLVLTLTAFAEDTLGRRLIQYLKGKTNKLRKSSRAFNASPGTISTQIKAAIARGLLAREQFDDLEILCRVRNSFAYDWQGVSRT